MMDYDDSWLFLRDFFLYDKSIVQHINSALGIKSKVIIRDTNEDVFLKDIISLLPNNIDGTTYVDFLRYVNPQYEQEETEANISVEEIEHSFLNHLWINILSNSKANRYFSEDFKRNSVPAEYIPYILLGSFGIDIEWLLYGGQSAFFFVDQVDCLSKLFDSLNKGYKSWQSPLHFYFNLKNLKSKLLWTRQLSQEQLYPLMVLFIVLRREWNESNNSSYISKKIKSLCKHNHASEVVRSVIYSIYDLYSDGDDDIRCMYTRVEIIKIDLHKLVVERIIKSGSYKILFDSEFSANGSNPGAKIDRWTYVEESYKDNVGKRLLVDYYFPHTNVREEDVFIPNDSLTDRIYVSLEKGKDYKQYWRNIKDGECFDYIQIYPMKNSSNEISDYRPIKYRNHLTKKGKFVIVEDVEKSKVNKEVKLEISNFRHDLKDLMEDPDIKNLKYIIAETKKQSLLFNNLFNGLVFLLGNNDDKECSLGQVREILKVLDNNQSNSNMDSQLKQLIAEIRDKIEDYAYVRDKSLISGIDVNRLKLLYYQSYDRIFSKIEGFGDGIRQRHETLCSCIKIFGKSLVDNQDNITIHEFLSDYIKYLGLNKKRVNVSADLFGIEKNLVIKYNRAALNVILNSIIDNAIEHGFSNYECENPMIKIIAEVKGDYVLLNICNNGKPISISNDDYKTRGVFKGETGHTGIGGYQISRYAELQGGYVEIHNTKSWNTEIHLYIKM